MAQVITEECGKTLGESKGELQRGLENVEVATGIPSMMMGHNLEDIASGIDELMIRQPVGVVAAITPFNFPAMIPLWFMPYAVACGNAIILKPSERTPMTMGRIMQLVDQAGFPPGVVNLVHGGKGAVDALLDHPDVRAISFVGSTPVAKYVYSRAAANGKRAQAQGGAKNPIVILPDADMAMTTQHRGRLVVRLRRPALPGVVGRHHRGRSGQDLHAAHRRRRRVAPHRLRGGRRHGDGAGDLVGQQDAHRRHHRVQPSRPAPSRSSTAAARRSRATSRATS